MLVSQNIKQMSLAFLITLGVLFHCTEARAGSAETLVVAGGCFWCVEADFEGVPGVISAVSGYTGRSDKNPTYKQVTRGGTGHYEAVKITFDATRVSRDTLLSLFFRSVDPTDAGGQFCDRGNSYRTAIFVNGAAQKKAVETAKPMPSQRLATTS